MMLNKLTAGFFILLLPVGSLFAAEASFKHSYEQGKQLAKETQGSIGSALGKLDPQVIFKQFKEHPDQEKLYGGVRDESSSLNQQAIEEAQKNPVAIKLKEDFNNRPEYRVDTASDTIKNSTWLIDHADEVVLGNTCKTVPVCETTYDYQMCQEQPSRRWFSCQKTLNVSVEQHVKEKKYPFTVHLDSRDHYYIGVVFDVTNGRLVDHGPSDVRASLDGRLPANIDCRTLHSAVTGGSISAKIIDGSHFPSCDGLTLNIHMTNPWKKHIKGTVNVEVISRIVETDIRDNWIDTCGQLSSDKQCKVDSEQCTQGQATKKIDGVEVTRVCWQKKFQYSCFANTNINNSCEPLRQQGCEQMGSVCHTQKEGMCLLYDQTMRCPIKSCSGQTKVICTQKPVCIDGDCTEHKKIPDGDFNQAVGGLGALTHAASQMDKNNLLIFSGIARSCSLAPIGYLNCCTDSGWGDVLGAKCDAEEKQLLKDKENHLVIQIQGDYCAKEVGGVCLSKRKRYCVFPSRIARLIQEKGRRDQLHIEFGTPKDPVCSGITPEDLQKIDFAKIDFTEVADEMKKAMPRQDVDAITERIKERVKELGEPNA